MLHELLYILHVVGMAVIILSSLYLVAGNIASDESRKKLALVMMSAAHLQLITGFALFFLMLADVNHMKIGIKMLLAIEVAVIATLYRRSVAGTGGPKPIFAVVTLVSSVTATAIAFLLK
jgi:hypothetical protein